MSDPRFITDAKGERVGVILDLATYKRLTAGEDDPELLSGLSEVELTALAESKLAPAEEALLAELTRASASRNLVEDEVQRLERLLEQIDQLNILKARARYTLKLRGQSERG